ncbi:MAG: transglycosylase SLT domain-containing protein [Bacteriovoracaceae bacterium]|nr:transglycosylase SLT domain-containing protein [Bacteriovoracaceae bacterium]
MKFYLIILVFMSCFKLYAAVEINSFKSTSWDNSWNNVINKTLDDEQYVHMLDEPLDESDLKELNCLGFNQSTTSREEKKDFWLVFFSALTRAESAFNPKARAKAPKGGQGNYGLLQFNKGTARDRCGIISIQELLEPNSQLSCGVHLLSWQLKGAPLKNGKLLRPDLKKQLFGKYILLWGPLRQNDKAGRKLLVSWFKDHLNQLSFCKRV